MTATPTEIVLYSRPGCHLCEDAHGALAAILADRSARGLPAPGIVECSIEDDDELHRRYMFVIPVVVLGTHELELATKPGQLARFLAEALDGAPAEGAPA